MAGLSDRERAFLDARRFAVLATINADGTSQQSTVWYELQGDEIMMNTRKGRLKDRNMRRDPRVSFCIEDGYAYIAIKGTVTLDDDQEVAQRDIHHLATIYHDPETADRETRNQYSKEPRVTIRLTIDRIKAYGL